MKNIILLILTIPILLSCSTQQKAVTIKENENAVGIARPTFNPNTPYIYINGFSDYTIVKIPLVRNDDTTFINELKFNATFSAFYSQEVMYQKFGKWARELNPSNETTLMLVWDNVKLFDDDDHLFTVYTFGEENMQEIYAAVYAFGPDQKDCLSEESIYREKIIAFFSNGIQHLKDDERFYKLYLKTEKKFKSKE